ncbi:MAG TPA: hypothetical protein VGF28_04880 [Thermoanaerobaculia bacterium]
MRRLQTNGTAKRFFGPIERLSDCFNRLSRHFIQLNGRFNHLTRDFNRFSGCFSRFTERFIHLNDCFSHLSRDFSHFIRDFNHFIRDFSRLDRRFSRARAPPDGHGPVALFTSEIQRKDKTMKTINPVPAPYADAAQALIQKIRALREEIPRFTEEVGGRRQPLGAKARVTDEDLQAASVAVARSSRLEVAAGTDAASLRDAYAYVLAFREVAREFAAMTRAVENTISIERSRAGASALDIYAIARRLAKHDDGAELVPFVDAMRKSLKTKQSRKTNSASDSAPAQTPTPSEK